MRLIDADALKKSLDFFFDNCEEQIIMEKLKPHIFRFDDKCEERRMMEKLNPYICPQCGGQVNRERMICEYCGTNFGVKYEY